jgi:hypothetical protein
MIRLVAMLMMMAGVSEMYGAGNLYVSMDGDNGGPGTLAAPFRAIEHALGLLGPGDTLFIRAGEYHEEIVMSNMAGTAEAPVVITYFPGYVVRLFGRLPFDTPCTLIDGCI